MRISYRLLKELKKPAHRKEYGLAVIEGVRLVTDAIKSRVELTAVFVSNGFIKQNISKNVSELLKVSGYEPVVLSDSLFAAVCDTKTPQGILAVIKMTGYKLEDLMGQNQTGHIKTQPESAGISENENIQQEGSGAYRQFVVLDGVSDPGNAGSVIRTAEAAGFTGVIMSNGCADLYSPKTLRAAMGSALRLPVVQGVDIKYAVSQFKEVGIKVIAAAPDANKSCYEADMSLDIALLIGSEAFGLSMEVIELCDEKVCIPMQGQTESLNAGLAAGILMYEALRQRVYVGACPTSHGRPETVTPTDE